MTRAELIAHVALRMDEITPELALSGIAVDGADNNPLYELINGIIDDGVLELFSVAPYWRLEQKVFPTTLVEALPDALGAFSPTADGGYTIVPRYVIRIKIPADFLRVAEIGCNKFLRPITEVSPEQSEQGKRQHNRHLIAKEARPVGIMSHGEWTSVVDEETITEHVREIDCYSVSTNVGVSVNATYIARPDAIADSGSTAVEDKVPSVLVPALEWLIAARAFGSRGDANHSSICQQNAQNLLM